MFRALVLLILVAAPILPVDGFAQSDGTVSDLSTRAQSGDVEAQTQLGLAYLEGRGVKVDYKRARHWFGLAARQNDPTAQNNLGRLLIFGKGGAPDVAAGVALYEKAIAQDEHAAQFNLAILLEDGTRVPKDIARAIALYTLASKKPTYSLPQYRLGEIYRTGNDVPVDKELAITWYREAAKRGHAVSQYQLANLMLEEHPGPLSEAQAFVLYTAAERAGHKKSAAQARKLKIKRAMSFTQSDKEEIYTLLNMSPSRLVVRASALTRDTTSRPANPGLSKLYFDLALSKDKAVGYFGLGVHSLGLDTPAELAKAETYFQKAAELGLNDAYYNLGWMHYTGKAANATDEQAYTYISEAANLIHMTNEGGAMQNQHVSANYADLLAAAMMITGRGTTPRPDFASVVLSWLVAPLSHTGATTSDPYIQRNAAEMQRVADSLTSKSAAHTKFSDEGTFFHEQGSPTPLHYKMSALIGETSADWEHCKFPKLAAALRKAVMNKLDHALGDTARNTLLHRIKKAYTTRKSNLKITSVMETCPDPADALEHTRQLLEFTSYDWGLKDVPQNTWQTVALNNRILSVGEIDTQHYFETFKPEPILALKTEALR